MDNIENNKWSNIYKFGKYYSPAISHYNYTINACVFCDRCLTQKLKICIGYEDKDLCMKCMKELSDVP